MDSSIMIATYHNFCIYFQLKEKRLQFVKQLNFRILNGYFWENLFFFVTENEIFMLIFDFCNEETMVIELANSE